MANSMAALGYPAYLLTLLGIWKVLGVGAILRPGHERLKEWAYAGFAFDLSGALFSHVAVGDGLGQILPPLAMLTLMAISWRTRPGFAAIR